MKILFYSFILLSSLFAKDVCITNFNKKVCKDFTFLESVIVKTTLSKKELQEKLNKPIKQIAFLKETNLFLVDSKQPLIYLKELEKKEYIIYAQPNILQTRDSNFKKTQNITKKYNLKKVCQTTKGKGLNIAIIDDGLTHHYYL